VRTGTGAVIIKGTGTSAATPKKVKGVRVSNLKGKKSCSIMVQTAGNVRISDTVCKK